MSKLRLSLEDLSVDTFETTAAEKERGTVVGQQLCTCYTCTCPGCPSCDATCPATCPVTCDDWSCAGSCDTCDTCDGWTCLATCQYDSCRPRLCPREPYYA